MRNKQSIANVTDMLLLCLVAIEFVKARDSSVVTRLNNHIRRLVSAHNRQVGNVDQVEAMQILLGEYQQIAFLAKGAVSENGAIVLHIHDTEGAELTLQLTAVRTTLKLRNKYRMFVCEFKLSHDGTTASSVQNSSAQFRPAFEVIRKRFTDGLYAYEDELNTSLKWGKVMTPTMLSNYATMLDLTI